MTGKSSSINLGLSATPETTDPALYGELYRIYNAINTLTYYLDQYTGAIARPVSDQSQVTPVESVLIGNMTRWYTTFAATVGQGKLVGINSSAQAVLANAATGSIVPALGFCNSPGGVSSGNVGEILLFGLNGNYTGLVPGTIYYSSPSTPGGVTATKPATVGNLIQEIGFALSATTIFFHPNLTRTLA